MLAQPKLLAAGLFHLLYVVGLLVFAVMPGLRERNWRTRRLAGAGVLRYL